MGRKSKYPKILNVDGPCLITIPIQCTTLPSNELSSPKSAHLRNPLLGPDVVRVLGELVDELLHLDVELDGAEVERRRLVAVGLQEGLVGQPHSPDPGGRLVHGDGVAEGDDGPANTPGAIRLHSMHA